MAWDGYYEYGGVEVINASRTEAYALNSGLGWFKPAYSNESLQPLLGDPVYSSPLQDEAPWTDYRDPDTFDFLGVYPLSIAGTEDSTWQGTVTENIGDGGVVGGIRNTTKTIVFQVALIGRTVCGAEAGMRWLREVLGGRPCIGPASGNCAGNDLCYLRCEPHLDMTEYRPRIVYALDPATGVITEAGRNQPDDLSDCLTDYLTTLRNVTLTVGPAIQQKQFISDGGAAWVVGFTAVAANPHEWSQEIPLVVGFGDPAVDVPYVDGIVPDGGMFDADGYIQTEVACPKVEYQPVYDPSCPFVIPPPGLPSVDITCFDFPVNYVRRQFTVPQDMVPTWGDMMPYLQIRTPGYEVRALRLRFYTDVLGSGSPASDPCNFCGDIVFSYIPANSTLVFDGSDKQVYLSTPGGGKRRADSLVFGSDGSPFEWPVLTCGVGYIVTVDLPQTQQPPIIDMSLYSRNGAFTRPRPVVVEEPPEPPPPPTDPNLLVPTDFWPGNNGFGVADPTNGTRFIADLVGPDVQWATNDGDTSYVRLAPGDSPGTGYFTLPPGIPEAWFFDPLLRVAMTVSTDWYDMNCEVYISDATGFPIIAGDLSAPFNSGDHGAPNDFADVAYHLNLMTTSAEDCYTAYLAGTLYIYVEAGGGTGTTDPAQAVHITEMLVDIG